MTQATRRAAFFCALAVSAIVSSAGLAQTSGTRTSSFGYDAASGLLTQEVIEPNQSAYRLQTDHVHDAFGNKVQVTVSGIDIVTRSSSTGYDAQGRFALTVTNALNQSESWQHDPRFGAPASHTGPNGLTTIWSYDVLGRKTLEVRADGTRTRWDYLFCSGFNGGTASCSSGAVYLIKATPLASDGTTQNGPISTVYFDRLSRDVAGDTQGFDGSAIRGATEYDSLGRVLRSSRPYFISGGTPKWTTFTYDALGRVLTETSPDNSIEQQAYHGLVTTHTNALNRTTTVTRNSQGQVVSVTDALNQITTYGYDPFGNLKQTADPVGNVVTATYDVRGRKVADSDPNLGAGTYTSDTLGQLVSQTDAKGQTTTVSYDKLGRLVQRVEPDMTAVWVYDTAAHGIGQLASSSITAGADAGYQRSFSYDSLGRPAQVATTIAGTTYAIGATYDVNGRLGSVTYPSGFAVNYTYTSLGHMHQLLNSTSSQVYWTMNAGDAELHRTQETSGNGVVTNRSFDANTGRLGAVTGGLASGTAVQSMSYNYDLLGNLLTRADANTGLSESFVYDELSRVTSATVGLSLAKAFSYNSIGNITAKSDVGNYAYPAPGQPRPHAVLSISGGAVNATFSYDPNGNQTAGLGRTITYTSYDKPGTITQGTRTISFSHDPDHQRFKQVAPEGTTLYLGAFGVYVELFQGSANRWNEYLMVGGSMVGVRFLNSDETVQTRYFHHDHLGSIAAITNESGAVLERNSYDAWGKRRFPSGADDPTGSVTSQTTRGFTGHEMLQEVGLVHMNGRVYDPLVGRMTSADPLVPAPFDGQSRNRYSYVLNNPLVYTDPTGHEHDETKIKEVFKKAWPLPPIEVYEGPPPPPAGMPSYYNLSGPDFKGVSSGLGSEGSTSGSWADPYLGDVSSGWGGGGGWSSSNFAPMPSATPMTAITVQNGRSHQPGTTAAPNASPGGASYAVNSGAYRYANDRSLLLPGDTLYNGRDVGAMWRGFGQQMLQTAFNVGATITCQICLQLAGNPQLFGPPADPAEALGRGQFLLGMAVAPLGANRAVTGGAAGSGNLIYRAATGTAASMTPRAFKDTKGLSAANSLANAKSGKNQIIDTTKLKNLCAECDNPVTGHVNIYPKDMSQMQSWIDSRGGASVHPLTQELKNAVVGEVIK